MSEPAGEAVHVAPRRRVPRVIDALALVLILGGVGVYFYAQQGMSRLAGGRMRFTAGEGTPGWNIADWGNYDRLSRAGLALAGAGIVLSIAALAWVTLRRPPALPDEQANRS